MEPGFWRKLASDRKNCYKAPTMSRSSIESSDRPDVRAFIERYWHSPFVMSLGRKFFPEKEEGFIERRDGEIVGLLTYHVENDVMEILTLNSTLEKSGIGSSLMLSAINAAREAECQKVLLTTTNDNLRAIGFYQRLGFRMVSINLGVVDEARKVKPSIPLTGERGIPIHDEIVMELDIHPYLEGGI